MSTMLERAARRVGAALGMFAALAACDRQPADAASKPYEIVTQMRPESREAYMKMFRPAYDVCALARTAMKLPPPPPLVALPADFVIKRNTYLGSGSSYLIRHEEFVVDIGDMKPETGCKTRIGSTLYEAVGRDGQIHSQARELDGHMDVDELMPLVKDPSKGSAYETSYTEKRTVSGIAMRCLPPTLLGGLTLDKCVANTEAGLLRDGAGDPLVLDARELVPGREKMIVLTEPVSVQIGKPVSPERIALTGAK